MTSLRQLVIQHDAGGLQRTVVAQGADWLARMPMSSAVEMTATIGCVEHPVFILGIDDPENATDLRWVV